MSRVDKISKFFLEFPTTPIFQMSRFFKYQQFFLEFPTTLRKVWNPWTADISRIGRYRSLPERHEMWAKRDIWKIRRYRRSPEKHESQYNQETWKFGGAEKFQKHNQSGQKNHPEIRPRVRSLGPHFWKISEHISEGDRATWSDELSDIFGPRFWRKSNKILEEIGAHFQRKSDHISRGSRTTCYEESWPHFRFPISDLRTRNGL